MTGVQSSQPDIVERNLVAVDILERVAKEQFSDPATDDLTVPLVIELADTFEKIDTLQARVEELTKALQLARDYLHVSLGSPSWTGPNPYPIIDAALALSLEDRK